MNWIMENWEAIATVVAVLIAYLMRTKWGKANQAALTAVAEVLEVVHKTGQQPSPKALKRKIAEKISETLNPSGQAAMGHVISLVDQAKKPKPFVKRLGGFLGRAAFGIFARRLG
jgi:hypothetical protein